MEELVQMISNYGTSIVIVMIFLWDYVANKKDIKKTLDTVRETSETISKCLVEMKQQNNNTAKSLELLQKSMDNTEHKIDRLIDKEILSGEDK